MDPFGIVFLFLVVLKPASLLYSGVKEGSVSITSESSELTLEAIHKLQEIFDFGELPHNIHPNKKPPQFMLELYSQVAELDGSTRAHGMLEGNIVRSFENKVFSGEGNSYFFFNVTSVLSKERLLKAELRVFKWKIQGIPSANIHHFCKVDVYELLDSAARPWRGNLITTRILPLRSQGWEMFNVTQTVAGWIGDETTNHGFLIVFSLPTGNVIDLSRITKIDNKRSYLVLFNDGRGGVSNPHMPPANVEETDIPDSSPNPSEATTYPTKHKSRIARAVHPDKHFPCQLMPLYVNFEEIGWSNWIISPKGYNAFHCNGTCIFPMGEGLGATNHATVQAIVHALKLNKDIGNPCCVPDSLTSINLLYYDDEENVVLRRYDKMVADSCGCH